MNILTFLKGKKTHLLGIAGVIQGFVPAIQAWDIAQTDWEMVKSGLGLIFLRLGISKVAPKPETK